MRFVIFAILVLGMGLPIAAQTHSSKTESQQHDLDLFFIEGFSKPFRSSNVAVATSGIIQEKIVREGTEVRAGEVLARIDDSVHKRLLEIAKIAKESVGELQAASANLGAVEKKLTIIRELAGRGSATPEELLNAESDYETAVANVKTMQEKQLLRNAEYGKLVAESENYSVEAPYDGMLIEYFKERGEFVGPLDPAICLIAELKTLSVDFLVPRAFRGDIAINREIEVHFLESNRRVTGTIYYVSPFPDGETNTYSVKVRVDNSSRELNAGERCQLSRMVMSDVAHADRNVKSRQPEDKSQGRYISVPRASATRN